jgi:hypothetical protein
LKAFLIGLSFTVKGIDLIRRTSLSATALIFSLLASPAAIASMELLAGVEAGIDTFTAMSESDLQQTQQILSESQADESRSWQNDNSGITYTITIRHPYTYGLYPCLSYELKIQHAELNDSKTLDACQPPGGHWISTSDGATTL